MAIVFLLFLFGLMTVTMTEDPWHPTSAIQCRTHDDCNNEHVCCSITPAFGRRRAAQERETPPPNWDYMVHYCLPWKNENATWCNLHIQYTPTMTSYYGLCPCAPGLRCTHTNELDPKHYPRDRFGKCTRV